MRIAFVTPEYITEKGFDGGLANYLNRVCTALTGMGHEVAVIVASDQSGVITQNGVVVHRVAIQSAALHRLMRFIPGHIRAASHWVLQSWLLNQACAKIHWQHRFDIIQYASYTATAFFRLKGVPSVVRLSSYEPMRLKAYDLPNSLNNRLHVYLDHTAIQRADAVFCPSNLVADAASRATGLPIEVIESPFTGNPEAADEQPYKEQLEGKKYLLFFGTLGVLKGVLSIAEIIEPLLSAHGDLFFVFVGKDVGYLGRPMIEHVYDKAGSLRSRVLYLGQLRQDQLYPVLAHAAAVALPSRVDNLPNTCLEAMACKRIVVGTRGASFEQLIEDKVNGFLVPIDSPADLLHATEAALALTDTERQELGERAANRIAALHPEITVKQLVAFYQSVIDAACRK